MNQKDQNCGPCASYVDTLWLDRPAKHIGYNAVGPGWHQILVDLDRMLVEILGYWTPSQLQIIQLKEKFGGLRVYYMQNSVDLSVEVMGKIRAAVDKAEAESLLTCEKCGVKEGVETRRKTGQKFSRTLTLCVEHQKERDENVVFQIGTSTI